jgi:hypothetical protein
VRLLEQSRREGFVPPAEAAGEPGGPGRAGPPGSVRQLWQRLFLLDQDRQWIAGARGGDETVRELVPVSVDGVTVGWLGFLQAHEASAPEARRFLTFQTRALLLSLLVGLLLAAALDGGCRA